MNSAMCRAAGIALFVVLVCHPHSPADWPGASQPNFLTTPSPALRYSMDMGGSDKYVVLKDNLIWRSDQLASWSDQPFQLQPGENLVASAVAVDPSDDRICVLYAVGSDDMLSFHYTIGTITSGEWTTLSGYPKTLSHPANGTTLTTNALMWADENNCELVAGGIPYTPSTYPYRWYGDVWQTPETVYSRRASVRVACVAGDFWFACGIGAMISHYAVNPPDYRYEEHVGLYLFSETSVGAEVVLTEECETEGNIHWQAPIAPVGDLAGDPSTSGDGNFHIIYRQGLIGDTVPDGTYYLGGAGPMQLSGISLPKVAVRAHKLYFVYGASGSIQYTQVDLSTNPPTFSSPTTIVTGSSYGTLCLGVSQNGQDLFTGIRGTYSLHLYKNGTYQNQIAEYTNLVPDVRLGIKSTNKGVILLNYGEEDRRGDVDYSMKILAQP